jgi:hypothetical protein
MNLSDKAKLKIALGLTEPLPLPNSLAEEVALAERKLADPILDRLPAYRGEGEVDRLLSVLDSLESGKRGGGGR